MNATIAKEIVSYGQAAGYNMEVVPDYSGRGMFGEKTCAVDARGMNEFMIGCIEYSRSMQDDVSDKRYQLLIMMIHGLRMDSLGIGWVFY